MELYLQSAENCQRVFFFLIGRKAIFQELYKFHLKNEEFSDRHKYEVKAKVNFFEMIFSTSQNSQLLDCSATHQSCLEYPLFFLYVPETLSF